MRNIEEQLKQGKEFVAFDYDLQVWMVNGVIKDCNHPESMKNGICNKTCNAHIYAGKHRNDVA